METGDRRGCRRRRAVFRLVLYLLVIWTVSGIGGRPAFAEEESVRVGLFYLNHFFEKSEDGSFTGYGIDYLNKLAEYTGWNYEYVWAENWDACVDLLRDGKVDMIAPARQTAERMEEFDFSSFRTGMECGTLLTLESREDLIYEDFAGFANVTVGCVDTLVFRDGFISYADMNGFTPNFVSYRDTAALMKALYAGEVDTALVNLFVKDEGTKVLARFDVRPFYIMLRKNHMELKTELDEAIQQLMMEFPEFENDLMARYYPDFGSTPFTKAELEYIRQMPVMRVACRPNGKPVSFVDPDTGEVLGITRDILDEVSRISGLSFEYVPLPEGVVSYEDIREMDIDLISSVEYNNVNVGMQGLHLTWPYLKSYKVFVTRDDEPLDVNANLRVAVATGSLTLQAVVQEFYPNAEVVICDSVEDCFEAVRTGRTELLLQNQYVVTPFLAKPRYSNLIAIPVESLPDQLSLSPLIYQKKGEIDPILNDERLISILNKAIQQVPENTLSQSVIRWTTDHPYEYTCMDFLYQYRVMLFVIGGILVILWATWLRGVKIRQENLRLIRENESRLRRITDNVSGGVVELSVEDDGIISYANEGFFKLIGAEEMTLDEMTDRLYSHYVHPEDQKSIEEIRTMELEGKTQISVRHRIRRRDGSWLPVLFNGTLTREPGGKRRLYCVIMDVSEQEQLMNRLSLEQEKYGLLMQNSGDIIFEIDCLKKILTVSPLYEEKFGWRLQQRVLPDILRVYEILQVYEPDQRTIEEELRMVLREKQSQESLVRILMREGGFRWCRIFQYPMVDAGGQVVDIIGKILDVDEEVRIREKLELKSRLDPLTGLLNKAAFYEMAQNYLNTASGKNTALIFLDLDNFKNINDTLGHLAGDQALRDIAKRLQIIFSNYDYIARFGGDEFCILLKEIPTETLKNKMNWMVEKLHKVYEQDGQTVACTVSAGAACTCGQDMDLGELLDMADRALYSAKDSGKNSFEIYGEESAGE